MANPMSSPASAAFDRIALRYDELWTNTETGRLQREAVWHRTDPLFPAGSRILDLGCGTGEDALHFARRGVSVRAFDASSEMVRLARTRNVDASGVVIEELAIEALDQLEGNYDGVFSNFGALNCVRNVERLRSPLACLIRPGGYLALCVIGRFCLWETAHYFLRGQFRKGARRWSGASESASLGLPVFYPSVRQIERALRPNFSIVQTTGVGLCVPPSYVSGLSPRSISNCAAIDCHLAHWPVLRSLSDHRLLTFVRK
jgi:2-polyprenyl-3-methyl-5-hydroxy-6-metoxy-1,4-benzoquinol methylase